MKDIQVRDVSYMLCLKTIIWVWRFDSEYGSWRAKLSVYFFPQLLRPLNFTNMLRGLVAMRLIYRQVSPLSHEATSASASPLSVSHNGEVTSHVNTRKRRRRGQSALS